MHVSSFTSVSFFVAVAVAASLPIGCASVVEDVDDERVSASQEALSTFKKLAGDYHRLDGKNFYETLSLGSNGKYTATYKPCGVFDRCATRPESGSWSAPSNRLKLNPAGAPPPKTFDVSVAGDGTGFKISANGATERLERDVPVCDPAVFAKVVAPTLADVKGKWSRSDQAGFLLTEETLVLRGDGTYHLTETKGPHCAPAQPCPLLPTRFLESNGTFTVQPGHGVQLFPAVSVPALAESFGLQKNCEGLLRLATTESSVDVYLMKDVNDCSDDSHCGSGQECQSISLCPPPAPGMVSCLGMRNACVAVAQAGQSCGFRTQTIPCARDLECKHVSGPLDALSCAPQGSAGQFCGGIGGIQCPADSHCVLGGSFPDAGGSCQLDCAPGLRKCMMCGAPPPDGVCRAFRCQPPGVMCPLVPGSSEQHVGSPPGSRERARRTT